MSIDKIYQKLSEYIDRTERHINVIKACDWPKFFYDSEKVFSEISGIDDVYVEVDLGRIRFHILMQDGLRSENFRRALYAVRKINDMYTDIVILSMVSSTDAFQHYDFINLKSLV